MNGEHFTIDMLGRTYGQTVVHPFALGFTLLMGIMMLFLSRRYAIIPMLLATLFITELQRIVIMSLDFNMMRILVLFGWVRVLSRGEIRSFKLNKIDKILILWAIVGVLIYTVKWRTSTAFINRLGNAFNIIGMYFLFRILIKDFNDFFTVIKALALISIPLALSMLIEHRSGRNIFSIFGGVPEVTVIREGRLRCQGSFSHPILAGTFGATLIPLFIGMWVQRGKSRLLILAGIIAGTIITITSASSGPVLSYFSGIVGFCLWPFRKKMRVIVLGLICVLFALQLYMKAPVWALIARVSVVGGSTGWHRFNLLDQFLRRFGEWWLIGTKYTDHWGYLLYDITNHFIRIAVDGGLITLMLFILVIYLCFRGIHKGLLILEELSANEKGKEKQLCIWSFEVTLIAHIVSFMGVSYFDQIIIVWYLLLAMISTATSYMYGISHSSKELISQTDTTLLR